ncbi:hypothetical protein OI69_13075 [Pectobacterium fontis]|uniref:Uncharacterized protein n=1 Tax=Pectobacterium fontis TaxID=2558042 RepID=A0A7V8IHV5_9GAMM|nr:hypothetical protein OI69_13075 [Pectobacterium fontis]
MLAALTSLIGLNVIVQCQTSHHRQSGSREAKHFGVFLSVSRCYALQVMMLFVVQYITKGEGQ